MKRIKLCGLTREEDVLLARALRVDFAGFVFAESRRRIDPARGAELVALLKGSAVRAVGVFVHTPPEEIGRIARETHLDVVQLPAGAAAEGIGLPLFRVLSIGGKEALAAREGIGGADHYLLDTHDPARGGGTGRSFDWERAARLPLPRPFLVAGGLTPENVGRAIRILAPDGVDVSSGVEERPGVKSETKVRRFVEEARAAWEEGA